MPITTQGAVQLFQETSVVNQMLSEQYEIRHPICTKAERAAWHKEILTVEACRKKHPYVIQRIEHQLSTQSEEEQKDATVKCFLLDVPIQKHPRGITNTRGLVLVLPEHFLDKIPELISQKPVITFARAIDLHGYAEYLVFKIQQVTITNIHDIWVNTHCIHALSNPPMARSDYARESSIALYWNDLVVMCGDTIGIGGYYENPDELTAMQVDSHGRTNFRPGKHFSEAEINAACAVAEAIGSTAPWEDRICMSEHGQRYRAARVLSARRSHVYVH